MGATIFLFVARLYPAPAPISHDALLVDRQYELTLYVTGVVFLLAQLSLAYVVVRFRDRGEKARFVRGNVVDSELVVPVHRPVELLLRSEDVVHNFFVRELRLQQDAMPGMIIPVHFTADQLGEYEIVCTQLCGLGHYKMHSLLRVVSQSEFEAFLNRQAMAP